MTRKKKLLLNSASSLIYQVVTVVCGFVLPRLMLSRFGSGVNGLVSSITQFLSLISLCELGVGAVVQSALYKPLAMEDSVGLSKIAISSERFFRKIAYILVGYVVLLMAYYPLIVIKDFDYLYTLLLILVISISNFAQYYFGMTYRLILSADQLGFVHYTTHTLVLILNTVSCLVLIELGAGIHVVKLTTSLIFLLQPIAYRTVAKRRYRIDRTIKLTEEPIRQKWNGMAQHLASVVLGNTATMTLTMFSTLENVSIYSVYHLVVHGVRQIIVSLTNGTQALFGNMLAKKETAQLNKTFDGVEWLFHTLVTVAFIITGLTVLPFMQVYTQNVTDANYIVPLFACVITLAQAVYCLRLPYNMMVLAAGHYKQTQASAIIEMVLNIVFSIGLTVLFGLVGVAVGMLIAMVYRTVYLAWYLTKHIIHREIKYFLKNLLVDIVCVVASVGVVSSIPGFYALSQTNYVAWFFLAAKVGITCVVIEVIVNLVLSREKLKYVLKRIRKNKK